MDRKTSISARNFLEIHLATLFISTSGFFGRYIDLPAPLTIAIRAALALLFLILYCKWKNKAFQIQNSDIFPILASGVLMGIHWVTYFMSLQLSNVAIGMISLFTYPVLTAFLEPFFLKIKFQKIHLLLGLLVMLGIYFLVPEINIENTNTLAIAIGVFSALCYSIRNLILKTKVNSYEGSVLMSYQMGIISLLLIPTYFIYDLDEVNTEWGGLIGVALITTMIGHTMFINTFKHFSITTISLISSSQPVFGIIIGALFLSEIPAWSTIFGGALILTAVVVESVRTYR